MEPNDQQYRILIWIKRHTRNGYIGEKKTVRFRILVASYGIMMKENYHTGQIWTVHWSSLGLQAQLFTCVSFVHHYYTLKDKCQHGCKN